jgi:hypothetical protein
MSQEIRRLHRRKTDFTNFSSNEPPYLTNPSNLTESSIQQDFDNASSLQPQIADSYSTASTDDLSAIIIQPWLSLTTGMILIVGLTVMNCSAMIIGIFSADMSNNLLSSTKFYQ